MTTTSACLKDEINNAHKIFTLNFKVLCKCNDEIRKLLLCDCLKYAQV